MYKNVVQCKMTYVALVLIIFARPFLVLVEEIIIPLFKFLFKPLFKSNKDGANNSLSKDWFGLCECCKKEAPLHQFEEKKYCAECHARLKTKNNLE